MSANKKLVLAYSGGLDTSVAIHWLKDKGWDVIAFTVDLGENKNRDDEIEYAQQHDIEVPATVREPYSTDENLWGRSIEAGVLEDPWAEPPHDVYTWTRDPRECPDEADYIEIGFKEGIPISIDGK